MKQYTITQHDDGRWTLAEVDSVGNIWPTITKPTARAVVARLMQLLEIGPVAPQIEPEQVCIGEVFTEGG